MLSNSFHTAIKKRFFHLFDQVPALIAVLRGPDHVFELANPMYMQLIGENRSIVGKTVREALPEIENQGFIELLDNVYRTGEAYNGQEIAAKIDRLGNGKLETVYLNFVYQPITDPEGNVEGIFAHGVDVTAQVAVRRSIEETEQKLSAIVSQTTAGIAQTDLTGTFVFVNQRYCEITGYEKEELLKRKMRDITHPDDLPKNMALFKSLVEAGNNFRLEKRYVRKDGSSVWVHNNVSLIRDVSGEPQGVLAVTIDISEQKKAQEELHYHATVSHNIADAVVGTDLEYRILSWNRGAESLYGWKAEEVIGKPAREIISTEFPAPYRTGEWQEALVSKGYWKGEVVQKDRNKRQIPILSSVANVKDEEGNVIGAVAVNRDISDRKKIEAEMRKLIAIIDATVDFVGLATVEGEITYLNQAAKQIVGWDEIMGRNMLECIHPEDRNFAKTVLLPQLFGRGHFFQEIRFFNEKTKEITWMLWNGIGIKDPQTEEIIALAAVGSVITDLKQVEAALRKSEQKLKDELTAMKRLHDLVVQLLMSSDLQSALDEVLNASIEIVGASKGNIQLYDTQRNVLEIFAHQGFDEDFLEYFRTVDGSENSACGRAIRDRKRIVIEDVQKEPSFKPHLAIAKSAGFRSVHSTPLLSRNSELLGMLSVHYQDPHSPSEREIRILDLYARQAADFLETVRNNQAIRKSEALFKTYAEAMPQMAFIADAEGRIIYFNQQWYGYVGEVRDTEGWGWVDKPIHHPDDLQRTVDMWKESVKTGKSYEIEYRLRRRDGEYRWHLGRAVAVRNSEGKIEMWLGTNTDIHEQKKAEEALKKSEEYYKSMTDNTPVMTWVTGSDGSASYLNKQWYDYTGQTPETALGLRWVEAVHPEEQVMAKEVYFDALEKKAAFSMEYRLRGKDGTYRWHIDEGLPKFDEEGNFEGHIGAVIDIHERKIAEEKLRESEEFSRTLLESSPDGVKALDLEGRLLKVNEQGQKMLEIDDVNKVYGVQWTTLWAGDFQPLAERAFETARRGGIGRFQGFRTTLKGNPKWWDVQVAPVYDQKGVVERLVCVSRDITQIKELEHQKDEFIGIASHELKTPVTSIKGSVQIIERLFQDGSYSLIGNFVKKANLHVEKLTNLINELLDVSRIQAGKLQYNMAEFEVREIIDDCIEQVSHQSKKHRVAVKGDSSITLYGDKIRLEQVVANFLTNAIKYSPDAEEIILEVCQKDTEFRLSVTDFGIGIPADKLLHVFDRFFRVEENSHVYQGLGLGLYISAEIIKRHGGEIGAESKEKAGSTFYFTLPR